MARYRFQSTFVDGVGRVVSGGQVTVYKAGTTTLATIYSTETTGTAVSGSVITTDDTGFFSFWVDDDDYPKSQRFDIVLSKTGFDTRTHSDVIIIGGLEYDYYPDFNESDHGVVGNGRTIKAYIDAAGSDSKTICLRPGTYTIATAITVPVNISIVVINGGLLAKSGTGSITINGAFNCGHYKVFNGFSTGDVRLTGEAYCEWFGAPVDGVSDDGAASLQALFAASVLRYVAGKTYTIKTEVAIQQRAKTIIATGAVVQGHADLSTAYMFSNTCTSGTGTGDRFRWEGGTIKTNGAKGWYTCRGMNTISLKSFKLQTIADATNLACIHILNSFNIYIDDFNIHGGNFAEDGIKVEGDAGYGFTVINNVQISNAIIQRCAKAANFTFATPSNIVRLENLAFLSDVANTYDIYITGTCDNFTIDDCKSEDSKYFLYVDNGSSTNRTGITARNIHTKNCVESFNLLGEKSYLTLEKAYFISVNSGTYNVFKVIDGEVVVVDLMRSLQGSGTTLKMSTDISGTGIIRYLQRNVSDNTSNFTIRAHQDNYIFTNAGASGNITFTLPACSSVKDGFRVTFLVKAAQNIILSPSGTDQIMLLTNAGGNTIGNKIVGSTISLVSNSGGQWYVTGLTGNWSGTTFIPFANGDTTPSVAYMLPFETNNTAPTTITNFDEGVVGQEITITFNDNNTTINDGGSFALNGNFTSTANDVLKLLYDGTVWREISRSVN